MASQSEIDAVLRGAQAELEKIPVDSVWRSRDGARWRVAESDAGLVRLQRVNSGLLDRKWVTDTAAELRRHWRLVDLPRPVLESFDRQGRLATWRAEARHDSHSL